MTLRFIFVCMAVVALCLGALPLLPVFNGIQAERETIIAARQAENYVIAVPPQVADEAAIEFAAEEDLSTIEPAAGANTRPQEFSNEYFSGQAPSALAEPPAPEEQTPEQDTGN